MDGPTTSTWTGTSGVTRSSRRPCIARYVTSMSPDGVGIESVRVPSLGVVALRAHGSRRASFQGSWNAESRALPRPRKTGQAGEDPRPLIPKTSGCSAVGQLGRLEAEHLVEERPADILVAG
jgi:hypothetical protein